MAAKEYMSAQITSQPGHSSISNAQAMRLTTSAVLSTGKSRSQAGVGEQSVYLRLGFKRALDIAIASVALLLIVPVLPIIILFLLIQDGTPIIYRQPRVGLAGRRFDCLKFRSMARDSAKRLETLLQTCSRSRAEWESSQKLKQDPRIHAVGAVLRRSSLDELPQLVNVLRGDMSIVGPRPMMTEQVSLYGESYSTYTSVRPGITGLWQVSGRNSLSFEQRVHFDGLYAQKVTFMSDMRILVRTVWVVLAGHGSY